MRFWDSSALVPLVADEPKSAAMEALLAEDSRIAAWWASPVECAGAIARKGRASATDEGRADDALRELAELASGWTEIPPGDRLRDLAVRLVRIHDLRTGDALQLAAALVASEGNPATLDLVTLDGRLALAASREGFRVLPG